MVAHWYDRDGNTAYNIIGANGKERDTTLRDARKFGYVPSVTTIIGQLSKPGLDIWKQNKLLDHAGNKALNIEQYLDFKHYKEEVLKSYKNELEQAPILGTSVHDELEQWYKNGAKTPPNDRIEKAVFTVREQIGKFDYKAEESFYCPLGFGGKIDLLGNELVIDFKTKNTDDLNKMIKTPEYAMQLAAYREGMKWPRGKCFNVYISTVDFNIVKIIEYTNEELTNAWQLFKCLLKFWQLSNGIKPEVEYVI